MQTFVESYTGDFYDADYYENGQGSGKGWLMNYRWMPQRSFREAFAYIDSLALKEEDRVLDVGCAKGFIVKALRALDIKADGCDISKYALQFAPEGCWECSLDESWDKHGKYTHVVAKDVFEHLNKQQLPEVLANIGKLTDSIMCVVPLGDRGRYRIPEYHKEVSHLIIEDETWWGSNFEANGWRVVGCRHKISGLKDNWSNRAAGRGNGFFKLKKVN